ncbi:GIN domain-containing protein [Aureivirga sp. CE67]|uniref:GIN domain-containing protein n=1 Tax=Aureivirga sp. CE67 TaxID=1788983 RepID=UPI0018CB13CB|nr:DUF2807 domain-containing protein [Aureivirga sp. CE67]
MKKIAYFLFIVLISCNVEEFEECFVEDSSIRTFEFTDLDSFENLVVNENILLEIKVGEESKIEIETTESLIDHFSFEIINNVLTLNFEPTCTIIKNNKVTKIILTTNNLKKIENNTQFKIYSEETLNFPEIIISTTSKESSDLAIGDFDLKLNSKSVSIIGVEFAGFKISGSTINLSIAFFSGAPFLDAKNFIADQVYVHQQSTNDVHIYPKKQLTGTIYSNGNVISYNTPEILNVEELYHGKLILK